jgi:hypothetical protein
MVALFPIQPAATIQVSAKPLSGQGAATPVAEAQACKADVESPRAITRALYHVISGNAGTPRDWPRFLSLFYPGAYLASTSKNDQTGEIKTSVRTPQEYISRNALYFAAHAFFESEIASRTQIFGQVAHVLSAYAAKSDKADPVPFARGLNSIELVSDGKRWWILSVSWIDERPDMPLPAATLPEALTK